MLLQADTHPLEVDNKARMEPPLTSRLALRWWPWLLEVQGNIAELVLDVTHDFLLTVVVKLQPHHWVPS